MNPLFENLKSLSYKDIRLIVEGKPALALEFIRLVKDSGRYQYYEFDGSYCVISLFSDEEHEDMHFYVAANASGCNVDWMTSEDKQKKYFQFYSHKEKGAFFDGVLGNVTW